MICRLVKKYARRAGLEPDQITPQTLRYTAASLRATSGADPAQIADLLGYTNPASADRLLRQLQINSNPPWQKFIELVVPPADTSSPRKPLSPRSRAQRAKRGNLLDN
jgi:integrase